MEPIIKYYPSGQIYREEWLVDGKRHRLDGPAVIIWHENGVKDSEHWYIDGRFHRLDGPAYEKWWIDGMKTAEQWWVDGKYHRLNGPAFLVWGVNQKNEQWFINGVNKSEGIIEWFEKNKIELDDNSCIVNKNDLILFKLRWG